MTEQLFLGQLKNTVHEFDKKTFDINTKKMQSHINVGIGQDITIRDLAYNVKEVVGYQGKIVFDEKKPDGAPRKLMNIDLLKKLGWKAKTNLKNGLLISYKDFLQKHYHAEK